MTTNHIDQLAEWWENAEESDDFYPGDTWIKRTQAQTGGYVYDVGRVTSKKRYYEARVLARAPKPAWHDAPAVTAKGREDWDHVEAFSRNDDYDPPRWIDNQGITYTAEQLSDVTPLIEAKVTDEMVERGRHIGQKGRALDAVMVRRILAAALGLEAE